MTTGIMEFVRHGEDQSGPRSDERITTPVGKCGDRVASNRPLTMHQATPSITMFGHHINSAAFGLVQRCLDRSD
jgi:hypothetical protein